MLKECRELWKARDVTKVFIYDRYLWSSGRCPLEWHSIDFLRAWKETRVLAMEAFERRGLEKGQTVITDWVKQEVAKDGRLGTGQEA